MSEQPASIPQWHVAGEWFDACNCTIPCPCSWAQPPTQTFCEGVLAWHVREGTYGDVPLAGLNLVIIGRFEGSLWGGDGRGSAGVFVDRRADQQQREALEMIFGGQAGGWPRVYAHLITMDPDAPFWEEAADIQLEVAEDLSWWRVEIPGKVSARAEPVTGPTTQPGVPVQVHNLPASDTGPGQVSTWARTTVNTVAAFEFRWDAPGRSSKHIPFEWHGPDAQ